MRMCRLWTCPLHTIPASEAGGRIAYEVARSVYPCSAQLVWSASGTGSPFLSKVQLDSTSTPRCTNEAERGALLSVITAHCKVTIEGGIRTGTLTPLTSSCTVLPYSMPSVTSAPATPNTFSSLTTFRTKVQLSIITFWCSAEK